MRTATDVLDNMHVLLSTLQFDKVSGAVDDVGQPETSYQETHS